MSLIDPDKVKQLLTEFNEKEAVTKAEIQEVERQVVELEARIEESRQLLVYIAEDREVIQGMKAEYGSAEWANLALKVGAELAARGGKRGESFLTGFKPVKTKLAPAAPAQAAAPAKAKTSQSKLAAIVNRDAEERKKSQTDLNPNPTSTPAAKAPAQAAQAKSAPLVDDSLASALVQAIGSEPAPASESSSDENPSLFLFSHPKENKDVDLWSLTPSVSWADLGDEIPADAASEPEPPAKTETIPVAQAAAPEPAPAPVSVAQPAPPPAPMPAPGPSPNPDADVSPQAQAPLPPQALEPMPESGPTPFLDDDEFETSDMAAESAPPSPAPLPASVMPPADLIAAASPASTADEKKDEPKSEAEEDVKKINDALRGLFS